ncbi:MAG: choice-of-anchor I family protein [Phycisphaerales bacterium JB054]
MSPSTHHRPSRRPTLLSRRAVRALIAAIGGLAAAASAQPSLEHVSTTPATSGGAEILAFDPASGTLYVTHASGLDLYRFDAGTLTPAGSIDLHGVVPMLADVTSVAIDPAGRGLGAVAVVPERSDTTPGVVVFLDTSSGSVVAQLRVGFHPDMVTFTPDGGAVLVANEGEPGEQADPAGGISVVDLSAVRTIADARALGDDDAATYDLTAANLAPGVTLGDVRISPANRDTPWLDVEPEYIAPDTDGAWVSLQENNALARFDLASRTWTAVRSLGVQIQTIDASDADGGAMIDDEVAGMPMPDTIASYLVGGVRYIVTANEGDVRAGDHVRLRDATLDPAVASILDLLYPDLAGGVRDDAALGRLEISSIDGDRDGDGDIDVPTMFGTRSMSIFDEQGTMVSDSGVVLRQFTALLFPDRFNSNGDAATVDTRSDDRGFEPEGVALATIDGGVYAFLGLERTSGVAVFDITDPHALGMPSYINTAAYSRAPGGGVGPEGLCVVQSRGEHYVLVACEVSATIEVLRVVRDAPDAGPTGND